MKVSKAFFGWVAETDIVLADGRVKRVTTCKRSSGKVVTTTAELIPVQVGAEFLGFTYNPFDGSNTSFSHGAVLATKAAIIKLHEEHLSKNS